MSILHQLCSNYSIHLIEKQFKEFQHQLFLLILYVCNQNYQDIYNYPHSDNFRLTLTFSAIYFVIQFVYILRVSELQHHSNQAYKNSFLKRLINRLLWQYKNLYCTEIFKSIETVLGIRYSNVFDNEGDVLYN